MRVGFASINKGWSSIDGVSTSKMISGVRPFAGTDRQDFFTNLYNRSISGGTPLREALGYIGQYYSRTDNRGPWGKTPGTDNSAAHLSCRSSYSILMTDGYWNGAAATAAAQSNNDSTDGPTITGPNSTSYTYSAQSPYADNNVNNVNTLADVAMYYWKNDLRASIDNRIPVSAIDPAFWQHMVTFGVGMGVTGSIDPETAFNAIHDNDTITWPTASTTGESANIDDLLHAAVNSRGGFFSAADPETFAQKLTDTLDDLTSREESSAAAIATNSTRLVDESLIFQARFDSNDWSGELRAYAIDNDGSVGTMEWTTKSSGMIPVHSARNIYSWNGAAGIEFYQTELSTVQQAVITADQVSWVRGDQSNEIDPTGDIAGGTLRTRGTDGVVPRILGDIVNSDPLVVGVPNFSYEMLSSGVAGQLEYEAFRETQDSRTRMLYVGGNDGMLHALEAATGVEKFAYVPAGVYGNLASLTSPDYTHKYYVDGSPSVGDAYIDGAWKTILVGSLGAGGRSIFALDVTDPDSFDEDMVLWEFGYAAGVDCAAGVKGCKDVGNTFGKPTVARMQNDKWAVIFGNGYGGDDYKAKLFIVNAATGELIKAVDAGSDGDSSTPNGLSQPVFLVDSTRTITTAYAGDLYGNMWKYDLSDSDIADWDESLLFAAPSNQSITSPAEIGSNPAGGKMVYFGTGKYFEVGDNDVSSPATNPGIQSFYGIWDDDETAVLADLTEQTIDYEGKLYPSSTDDLRVVSNNAVEYNNNHYGWYMNLVSPEDGIQGERVVSAPLLRRDRIVFTTLRPIDDPCSTGGVSWLMELDSLTGGRTIGSAFDVNDDGAVNDSDYVTITTTDGDEVRVSVSGRKSQVGIVKTPAVIEAGQVEYKYFGGSDGAIEVVREVGGDDDTFGRRSWRQLR